MTDKKIFNVGLTIKVGLNNNNEIAVPDQNPRQNVHPIRIPKKLGLNLQNNLLKGLNNLLCVTIIVNPILTNKKIIKFSITYIYYF